LCLLSSGMWLQRVAIKTWSVSSENTINQPSHPNPFPRRRLDINGRPSRNHCQACEALAFSSVYSMLPWIPRLCLPRCVTLTRQCVPRLGLGERQTLKAKTFDLITGTAQPPWWLHLVSVSCSESHVVLIVSRAPSLDCCSLIISRFFFSERRRHPFQKRQSTSGLSLAVRKHIYFSTNQPVRRVRVCGQGPRNVGYRRGRREWMIWVTLYNLCTLIHNSFPLVLFIHSWVNGRSGH
jgi:hypothetical protein